MKIKVAMPDDNKFDGFLLIDDDTGEQIGKIAPVSCSAVGIPKLEQLTRFQNAKLVIDGKSMKRLKKKIEGL